MKNTKELEVREVVQKDLSIVYIPEQTILDAHFHICETFHLSIIIIFTASLFCTQYHVSFYISSYKSCCLIIFR